MWRPIEESQGILRPGPISERVGEYGGVGLYRKESGNVEPDWKKARECEVVDLYWCESGNMKPDRKDSRNVES